MNINKLILVIAVIFFSSFNTTVPHSIYDFKVVALHQKEIDFSRFKGKKILIVNAPWLTVDEPQYAELDKLYKKYQGKLVVVAFLTDDFGIAPGSHKDAAHYFEMDYGVSYPIATKVDIRGNNISPVFKWLTDKTYNNFKSSNIKWNFQKYLLDENGNLVAVFDPKIHAFDPAIIAAIEK